MGQTTGLIFEGKAGVGGRGSTPLPPILLNILNFVTDGGVE
jgi:hypothetical protein